MVTDPRSTAAATFLRMADLGSTNDPTNSHYRLHRFAVRYRLHQISPGTVEIALVEALPMGEGHGSRCLAWLCQLADHFGVRLVAQIRRVSTGGAKPDYNQLRRWYMSYGFAPRRGGIMERHANRP